MMCPIQNRIVCSPIDSPEPIGWQSDEINRMQREATACLLELSGNSLTMWNMIRVTEHLNIGMYLEGILAMF
jgi:hypothetical protein